MPRRNGTGPLGLGPMTGWGFGPCGWGMGMGRGMMGRGFGRYAGFCPFYPAELSGKDELKVLEGEAEYLEEELKEIRKRVSELSARK